MVAVWNSRAMLRSPVRLQLKVAREVSDPVAPPAGAGLAAKSNGVSTAGVRERARVRRVVFIWYRLFEAEDG
jgi:hypothetical protein